MEELLDAAAKFRINLVRYRIKKSFTPHGSSCSVLGLNLSRKLLPLIV